MPTYRLSSSGGVVRLADNVHIPADVANRDWQGYLAFSAAGGTPDAATELSLSDKRAAAKLSVNAAAELHRGTSIVGPGSATALWQALRFSEADRANADSSGNRTSGNYPLLAAEIPETAATVGLVMSAILTERTTLITAFAAIENIRRTAFADIDAAGSNSAVDAVVAAITWPA